MEENRLEDLWEIILIVNLLTGFFLLLGALKTQWAWPPIYLNESVVSTHAAIFLATFCSTFLPTTIYLLAKTWDSEFALLTYFLCLILMAPATLPFGQFIYITPILLFLVVIALPWALHLKLSHHVQRRGRPTIQRTHYHHQLIQPQDSYNHKTKRRPPSSGDKEDDIEIYLELDDES
ncbi:MAG: hypothetical protein ABDH32_01190 [Candidatus Caldarchaeales archaeon]